MNKIIFFLPYLDMEKVVMRTFMEQNQSDTEWQLETILKLGTQQLDRITVQGDVVIARGGTYRKLKKCLHTAPVTELLISGYDIMRTVLACKKEFNTDRIAFLGTRSMIYGAQNISQIIPVQVIAKEVYEENETRNSLIALQKRGIDTMIGGVTSTRIAAELGMNALRIDSGQEAIYQAIAEAKQMFKIYQQERERTEIFRTILDYTSDGIVAINTDNRILLINHEASNITGISSQATGQRIETVLPQIKLQNTLGKMQPAFNEIIQLNDQDITMNSIPMQVENQPIGAIATFQPILKVQNLGNEIRRKKSKRGHVAKFTFDDILGNSISIRQIIHLAKQYSKTDANILITGETGTGKELFAQSIHNASNRFREPFVALNCAVLSENLLESELFGYVEGAFTDARKGGKSGLFEAAHNGTLFLDEISEISPRMQGILLRVLQEHEIMRVGDDRIIPVNVRIIVATNRDLLQMSQAGEFRLDLYYRLDTLHLMLPPLRERNQDVLIIFCHFLKVLYNKKGIIWKGMTYEAEKRLLAEKWPGNIRELYNIAERVAVFTKGEKLDVDDLNVALRGRGDFSPIPAKKITEIIGEHISDIDDRMLLAALEQTHYHYGKTAALLGISRTTLWRRLRCLKINKCRGEHYM
jgi:transcriptional regulator, propionate catabolism operon regulatory protein